MKQPTTPQLEKLFEQWMEFELESAPEIFPSLKVQIKLCEWEGSGEGSDFFDYSAVLEAAN